LASAPLGAIFNVIPDGGQFLAPRKRTATDFACLFRKVGFLMLGHNKYTYGWLERGSKKKPGKN